ncbi:MAG: glycoside hydrolase family 2 protein [Acidimicrobiales bacterium]
MDGKDQPVEQPLRTQWADQVDPERPLPDYPRPQLRRPRWTNLNGPWDAAVTSRHDPAPTDWPHILTVPFPMGSTLSGMAETLRPDQRLWLRRTIDAVHVADGERLRVHFGAVDWETEVWFNNQPVGGHRGGFDPFHLDLTDALIEDQNELVVAVWDPTDVGPQPVGKQTLNPSAIQYTPVAGIWQTVWLEPVPIACLESVWTTTCLADNELTVHVATSGSTPGDRVHLWVYADGVEVGHGRTLLDGDGADVPVTMAALRPWSPDDPFLYDLVIEVQRDDETIDRADSYAGAREIAIGPDAAGTLRLHLNGEPIFHLGLLDQGWWPDGLYTAPTDDALVFDIETTLAMGFNTIRKHVKVEPARWYWHADRLGLLVWQDMPNTWFDLNEVITQMLDGIDPADMDYSRIGTADDPDGFRRELDAMIDALRPHPSIVVWVPFNEGWGQFDTTVILDHVAQRDPSRLVDGASGWVDDGSGHMRDHHVYRKEADFPALDEHRATVYGEFGGLGLEVDGHVSHPGGWGYARLDSPESLAAAYEELVDVVAGLVDRGLAGAIYTQTTDVESEHNGLMTYDRAVIKIAPDRLAEMNRRILER